MDILYCVSGQDYIDYWTFVSIKSVIENNKCNINFHIITDNDYNFEDIKNYLKNYNSTLNIYKINELDFIKFKVSEASKRWEHKYAPFYRLKLLEFINSDKCLYLDNDVICDGDLSKLYNTNIETIGVIKDFDAINRPNDYFNSGVILFNIKNIKEKYSNLFSLCLNESLLHPEDTADDQDILNRIFKNNKVLLSQIYNYFTRFGENNNAILYHFTGLQKKPWTLGFYNEPNFNVYKKYKNKDVMKINIVIATQGYRFEWLKNRVIPSLLKSISIQEIYNSINKIYIVPNNKGDYTLNDYNNAFKNIEKIEIIEGNDDYKCFNKFIPYYTKIGNEYPTIHMDDDLIVNQNFIYKHIKTIEMFPNLVVGSGKCEYYQIKNDGLRINKSLKLAPLVSDCITNMVWLNNGFIYLPKGCLQNSIVLDWNLLKTNKYNKLFDESVLQLHLLLNNYQSYIINDTLNIGADQIPFINDYYKTVKTTQTLTGNQQKNIDEFVQFEELINSDEYRNIIVKNLMSSDFVALINNSNAMAVYLLKDKLSEIFRKEKINITIRPDEYLNYSWLELFSTRWRVDY